MPLLPVYCGTGQHSQEAAPFFCRRSNCEKAVLCFESSGGAPFVAPVPFSE